MDAEEDDLGETGDPFVTVSLTVSGNLPEDVVAALRGALALLRET